MPVNFLLVFNFSYGWGERQGRQGTDLEKFLPLQKSDLG